MKTFLFLLGATVLVIPTQAFASRDVTKELCLMEFKNSFESRAETGVFKLKTAACGCFAPDYANYIIDPELVLFLRSQFPKAFEEKREFPVERKARDACYAAVTRSTSALVQWIEHPDCIEFQEISIQKRKDSCIYKARKTFEKSRAAPVGR